MTEPSIPSLNLSSHQIASLTIKNGNGSTVPGYETFDKCKLIVSAVDSMGQNLPNATVVFEIGIPEGSNATATFAGGRAISMASTNAQGLVECPTITTGGGMGSLTVAVYCGASTAVTFNLGVTYPTVATISMTYGDKQTLNLGQNVQFEPLVVTLFDKAGHLVLDNADSAVTFQINGQEYRAAVRFPSGSFIATAPSSNGVVTSPIFMVVDDLEPIGTFEIIAYSSSSWVEPTPQVTFTEIIVS